MATAYDLFGEVLEEHGRNRNEEYNIGGLTYIPNFITKAEHEYLLKQIDAQPWLDELKRRVQHYGYKYDYKSHKIDQSMKINNLPDWLQSFAERLTELGIFDVAPDQ